MMEYMRSGVVEKLERRIRMVKEYEIVPSINWSEKPWEPIREGAERKIFAGEGITITLNRLTRAFTPRPHKHPYEHIVHLVSGRLEFHVGDDVHKLVPGSCLLVPADVIHYGVPGEEENVNLDAIPVKPGDMKATYEP